ncbi:C4-dicarboxylate transporter DctQ subunit [Amorphus suaedae]
MRGSPAMRGGRIGSGLDLACDAMIYAAATGTAVLIAAYLYEIVARYVFSAPTTWANDLVSIVLSLSIFLAMPKVAAEGGHVAVTLLQERLPERPARALNVVLLTVACLTCVAVAVICAMVAHRQVLSGTMTMGNHPVPKAILTVVIALGFALAGCQYLKSLVLLPRTGAPARPGFEV